MVHRVQNKISITKNNGLVASAIEKLFLCLKNKTKKQMHETNTTAVQTSKSVDE